MALDDLRRKIFTKDEQFADRRLPPQLSQHRDKVATAWNNGVEVPSPDMMRRKKRMRMFVWSAVGIAACVVLGFGFLYLISTGLISFGVDLDKKLEVSVEGATEVTGGDRATWHVKIKNANTTKLESVEVSFEFPPGSQPVVGDLSENGLKKERHTIGTLEPGESKEEIFSAIVFGSKDQVLPGKVSVEYRPESASAHFSKEVTFESKVTTTLLGVELDMPDELRAGQNVTAKIRVISSSEKKFSGLSLRVTYPSGFEFVSSEPDPTRANGLWTFGDLDAGKEFSITIHGKIKDSSDPQPLRAEVGLYNRTENNLAVLTGVTKAFTVSAPLLAVTLTPNVSNLLAEDILAAGRSVEVTVAWRNNLPVTVRNALIEVAFEGDALDVRSIKSQTGEYNSSLNGLQWVPGRNKNLSTVDSGASGTFSFTFAPKKDIFAQGDLAKDFTIRMRGSMKALEVPVGFDGVNITGESSKEFKVATRLTFTQRGYFYDSRLANTGPLPPIVGQETTYTIVWSLLNTSSDVTGTKIRATLPTNVSWKGVTVPRDSTLTFNPSTREVTWSPERIPAGTGYSSPSREVAFQIGLVPTLPQIDTDAELISSAHIDAQDSFSKYSFSYDEKGIGSSVHDDAKASALGGRVRQ